MGRLLPQGSAKRHAISARPGRVTHRFRAAFRLARPCERGKRNPYAGTAQASMRINYVLGEVQAWAARDGPSTSYDPCRSSIESRSIEE